MQCLFGMRGKHRWFSTQRPPSPAFGDAPQGVEPSVLITQPGDDADQVTGWVGWRSSRCGNHSGVVLLTPLCLKRPLRVQRMDARGTPPAAATS